MTPPPLSVQSKLTSTVCRTGLEQHGRGREHCMALHSAEPRNWRRGCAAQRALHCHWDAFGDPHQQCGRGAHVPHWSNRWRRVGGAAENTPIACDGPGQAVPRACAERERLRPRPKQAREMLSHDLRLEPGWREREEA
eukprot:364230-Chlamydomonas_euryale.AAC.11